MLPSFTFVKKSEEIKTLDLAYIGNDTIVETTKTGIRASDSSISYAANNGIDRASEIMPFFAGLYAAATGEITRHAHYGEALHRTFLISDSGNQRPINTFGHVGHRAPNGEFLKIGAGNK